MRLFVATLLFALVVANQAFFVNDLLEKVDLGELVKTLGTAALSTAAKTLLTGALGKRDLDFDELELLSDMTKTTDQKTDVMSFWQKLQEARKAGNVKEFLAKHAKEQREKMLSKLTTEQRQKYEAHKKRIEAYRAKVAVCQTAVKTAKEAAAKTADKTDGSRRDLYKVYMECMKKDATKTEEKTAEKQEDVSALKEKMQKFRAAFEEAKKNGNLKEFLKTHHENMLKQLKEQREKMIAGMSTEMKQRLEAHKQRMSNMKTKVENCRTKTAAMKDASRMEQARSFLKCLTEKAEEKKEEKQEDMKRPRFPKMTPEQKAEFQKKLEEAKKAGKVKEFWENFRKEQAAKKEAARKAYEAKKAECMKKVEEAKKNAADADKFDAKMEMRSCMMTEEQKKMMEMKKQCAEKVKAAKAEAEKQKQQFSRQDAMKVFHGCMKGEEKTEEKQEDSNMKYMTVEEKAEFRQKVAEAKKAGNLREFMTNFRKEFEAKVASKKAECEKKVKEMKANVQDGDDFNAKREMKRCMRPPRPTTTAGPTTMPSRSTQDMMTTPEMMTTVV